MALYIPRKRFPFGAAFVCQAGNFWTLLHTLKVSSRFEVLVQYLFCTLWRHLSVVNFGLKLFKIVTYKTWGYCFTFGSNIFPLPPPKKNYPLPLDALERERCVEKTQFNAGAECFPWPWSNRDLTVRESSSKPTSVGLRKTGQQLMLALRGKDFGIFGLLCWQFFQSCTTS